MRGRRKRRRKVGEGPDRLIPRQDHFALAGYTVPLLNVDRVVVGAAGDLAAIWRPRYSTDVLPKIPTHIPVITPIPANFAAMVPARSSLR